MRPARETTPRVENPFRGRKVAVVGAGIVGLMQALWLQEKEGARVTIYSPLKPNQTTSEIAGASWKPAYLDVQNKGTLTQVLTDSWGYYNELIDQGVPGIYKMQHFEAANRSQEEWDQIVAEKQYYLDIIGSYKRHDKAQETPGGYAHSISYETVHFEPPVFLEALFTRFTENLGTFSLIKSPYESKEDMLRQIQGEDVIFNCTGLGAGKLVGVEESEKMRPVAGEVFVMGPIRWRSGQRPFSLSALPDGEDLPEGFSANYVYPRENDTVVGGTSFHGHLSRVRPNVLDLLVAGAEKILGRRINRAKIKPKVADRPYRDGGIRMESEFVSTQDGRKVLLVHNYGHGGAGFTTAAGTAAYVSEISKEKLL